MKETFVQNEEDSAINDQKAERAKRKKEALAKTEQALRALQDEVKNYKTSFTEEMIQAIKDHNEHRFDFRESLIRPPGLFGEQRKNKRKVKKTKK